MEGCDAKFEAAPASCVIQPDLLDLSYSVSLLLCVVVKITLKNMEGVAILL